MEQPLFPEIEELLHDLQPDRLYDIRMYAVKKLGQLNTSDLRIVQALANVKEYDPNYQIRELAKQSLCAPAHQEILQKHPDLLTSTPKRTTSPIKRLSATRERELVPVQRASVSKMTTPSAEKVPACSVCGRRDETLRYVAYPYVFSVIFVTYRRVFEGLWCRKHRNLRLILASLITATIGWIGIPFGFILTPITLFKLARGGEPLYESNANLLRRLAEHLLRSGDTETALHCLEASLQFQDDDAIRERLREVRRNAILPVEPTSWHRVVTTLMGVLFGAAGIGTAIGVLDYVITALFSLLGGHDSIYIVILSWTPFVTMAFMGGMVLFQLIEWALVRIRCCKRFPAISIGAVAAIVAVYGVLQSSAVSEYVAALLSGGAFESFFHTIFIGVLVILAGGIFWIIDLTEPAMTSDYIYIILLSVIAVYYLGMAIWTAIQTTRWQQRLSE